MRALALTSIAFALATGIVSWVGFAGIFGEQGGSQANPSHFAQVWPMIALLGLACLIVPTVAWAYRRSALADQAMSWLTLHYRAGLLILLVGVAVALAVGVTALRAFPNSGDEYDYLFQAATFRAGRLWNPLPPVAHVFSTFHIAEKDGKWVSWYWPGWSLILAAGTRLGLPAFAICPTLALLLLLAFSRLSRLLVGPAAALLGVTLLGCCPFFLFNGVSYFNHVPTALFAVLFVLCGVRFLRTTSSAWALLTGVALGVVGVIRPYTALPLVITYAVEFLLRAERRHYFRMLFIVLGGLPFLVGLLLYDRAITGSLWATTMGWMSPELHLGLHPVNEGGMPVSLATTGKIAISYLFELCQYTSSLLLILYIAALLWKLRERRLAFYDFVFPMTVLFYLMFASRAGNQYGPRYYFDAYPFLVLTVVSATAAWLPEQRSRFLQVSVMAMLSGAIIMAVTAYPALVYQYHRVVNGRMELYDLVADAHLTNAVVVIGSHTGSAYPFWMESRDLTRNGVDLSGSVLYVNDTQGGTCALAQVYPGRSFYRYETENNRYPGQLQPISACP